MIIWQGDGPIDPGPQRHLYTSHTTTEKRYRRAVEKSCKSEATFSAELTLMSIGAAVGKRMSILSTSSGNGTN
jgi:hypothetical protein